MAHLQVALGEWDIEARSEQPVGGFHPLLCEVGKERCLALHSPFLGQAEAGTWFGELEPPTCWGGSGLSENRRIPVSLELTHEKEWDCISMAVSGGEMKEEPRM